MGTKVEHRNPVFVAVLISRLNLILSRLHLIIGISVSHVILSSLVYTSSLTIPMLFEFRRVALFPQHKLKE
jgi:hypothetical protein